MNRAFFNSMQRGTTEKVTRINRLGMVSTTPHFPTELTIGPTKLECYIALGWKGLLKTNILVYWAHA